MNRFGAVKEKNQKDKLQQYRDISNVELSQLTHNLNNPARFCPLCNKFKKLKGGNGKTGENFRCADCKPKR
jgi:tRNA(Ile2) C34 agmatinyltransferase TiaS